MRNLITGLMALAIAGLGAVSGAEADSPPPGAVRLGGLNLSAYCAQQYGPSFKSAVVANTVEWQCEVKIHHAGAHAFRIDMNAACLWAYRLPGVAAYLTIPGNPASWFCYRGGHRINPL